MMLNTQAKSLRGHHLQPIAIYWSSFHSQQLATPILVLASLMTGSHFIWLQCVVCCYPAVLQIVVAELPLLTCCGPLQKEGGNDVMYFVLSYRVETAHWTRQQMLNCKGLATITMWRGILKGPAIVDKNLSYVVWINKIWLLKLRARWTHLFH